MKIALEIKRFFALILISIGGAMLSATTADAATITGPFNFGPSNIGSGSATVTTTTPNGTFGNTIDVRKNFITGGVLSYNFLLPFSISGTEYRVTETITNSTGDTWEDFTVTMGCGDGTVDCGVFRPLELDYTQTVTNSATGAVLTSGTSPILLHWNSMDVTPGQSFDLAFSIFTCSNCSGSWAIGESPSIAAVPEPAIWQIFAIGIIALVFSNRRRRHF